MEDLNGKIGNNDIEGVREFILNCDNIKDIINGRYSLTYASIKGYTEIVKMLLEVEGIDVNIQGNNDRCTSLTYASIKGYTDIVKMLLEVEGIDVNIQNISGSTALIDASRSGYTSTVKLLLEVEGLDFNIQDNSENNSLILASMYGRSITVKMLISKGANSANPLDPNKYKDGEFNRVGIFDILTNWKMFLPRFNILKNYKYYPSYFFSIAKVWLLVCKRKKKEFQINKDIRILLLTYIAESWKRS